MRCSKCGSDNREGRKFCTNCGTSLVASCPKCGAPIQSGEKFCGECGTALGDATAPKAEDTIPVAVSATGERRHLTVLFCDLVGSTEIAAQLDPEEWRELVAGYHRAAAEAITRFGGHVAKYLGDGVMAYFGWPEAHDNDGERAARAGLALLDVISKLNQPSGAGFSPSSAVRLSVRVGIDSGAVVVGAGAAKEADVFGEAPNIAARLQATATPDAVLITAATHRLISGLFVVEALGPRPLKGIATPPEVFQVVRPTGVRGKLAAARSLTPLVGREEELRLLLSRWQRAREGEGQLALVVGEAGIGKSRLVAEFHDRIRDTPHTWMESAGEQFFENSPFHPLTEMLSQWLQLQALGGAQRSRAKESATCVLEDGSARCAPEDEGIERLERALASAGLKLNEAVPLIAELLQLPVAQRYPSLTMAPEQKRRRLFALLMGWVFGAARLQPLVMVVEDLHWLDPSTLEFQQLLAEQGATVPLMLLYTTRPEFRAPWPLRAHHTQITLNRLTAGNAREMIAQVAACKALADETVETVLERTSGVPLFIEELTRAVLESVDRNTRAREIPVTLHDSLMARLDRLGPAKEIIQIGAVIGTEFSYELLHAVHPIPQPELEVALSSATDTELIYARGLAPEAIYQFKHALIRDAAYEALLKTRRKELHRLVAQAIEEKFPALKEVSPEILARHWTEAGEIESAVAEWNRAGGAAEGRNAFIEALENYQQAAVLFKLLPESADRDDRELEVRTSIVQMLQITKGWSSKEAAEAIEHAATLAEQGGNIRQLANWMGSRTFAAWISSNLSTALDLAERNHQLRLRLGMATGLAYSHLLQLMVRFWIGDLTGAEKHYQKGLRFFDDPAFRNDPIGSAIAAFAYGSWTALLLGRPDVARARLNLMREAIDKRNLHEVTFAGHHEPNLWVDMREYQRANAVAARTLELSQKEQFADAIARSQCSLGYARAQLGCPADGVALIREGLAGLREIQSPLRASYYMATLADAQRLEGKLGEAIATADRALLMNPEQVTYRPEMYRIRGEIHLMLAQPELAEADFQAAIGLSEKIGAKAWELRATMSLVHLLSQQGRRDEARTMVADIYNWFTEGFDTADLKDAKALLEELSA
jgi:class 3 adenylate cyclase/tetratricopeptide (TPR) repeat protein